MSSQPMGFLVTAFLLSFCIAPINTQSLGECTTPNGRHGHCIRVLSCASIFALLERDIPSDSDINNLRQSQCGTRNGHILICCPIQIAPQQPQQPQQLQQTQQPQQPQQMQQTQQPQQQNLTGPRSPGEPGNILPQPGICGRGNTDSVGIANRTRVDEFPWMALLRYSKPGNNSGFHCAGTLINSRYVLTASKCVNGEHVPSDWRLSSVRLGEWNTDSTNDCKDDKCSPPSIDVPIERTITHELYNPNLKSQVHDIALLRLSESIPYSDWIKPICLPSATHLRNTTFDGFNMDTVEWAIDDNDVPYFIKRKTRVDGVDLSKCNGVYRHLGANPLYTHVCAGVGDRCINASGGPLIGLDKSGHLPYVYLAGMFSFGLSCANKKVPRVYTRVNSYIDWIQNNIRP